MKRLSIILLFVIALAAESVGALIVDNTTPLSDNNRVIYELNVYDFTTQGTFAAAKQRLPELRKLGIDIIWLMPIHPRGIQGKIGTLGSPYAPKNYTAVNPAHGNINDLIAFVNYAHELGMKVWLDWVPNHTGLDHVWVTEHPDYYVWQNGQIIHPNNYGDVYQLNYNSAAMKNAMIEAMRYWVNTADIDGFRCNYASSPAISAGFWEQAINALQTNNRNKAVEFLAEADFTDPNASSELFKAGFRYDYMWGYADGIKSVGKGNDCTNLKNTADALLFELNNRYSAMSRMSYITNHDDIGNNFSGNYLTQCGDNVPPLTVMYFTFFGMPLIYNGQEIGCTNILNYFERNTINWNNTNTKIHNTIRALVALKHTQPALADGIASERASIRQLTTNNKAVFAFERKKGDNTIIVILGLNDNPVDVTVSGISAGAYTRVLDSETISSGFNTTPTNLNSSSTIHLGKKGYHIYTNGTDYETHHLYVNNQTSWAQFDLYGWGDCEFFGKWPGATNAPTILLDGTIWRNYEYAVAKDQQNMEMHLIFHNNVGENQPGDKRCLVDLTQTGNYYLTLTDSGYDITAEVEAIDTSSPFMEQQHATKILINEQLFILHNGIYYTPQGTVVNW